MHRIKKHFGQHFLQDANYLNKIIQSIPTAPIACIEIGVGLGDLTQELLKIESVIAYEVDLDLHSLLNEKFSSHINAGRLSIVYEDVLARKDTQHWLYHSDYKVVSNLPYYIATHIILRLLRDNACRSFIVMTQKEVAEKFCAKSGERAFCALSVLAQSLGDINMLFDVPKEAFNPPPSVTSSVFIMQKYDKPSFEGFSLYELETFLKYAFSAPRKKLISNLAQRFDKGSVESALKSLHISPNARAHELERESFHHILHILKDT